ncbi:YeiH family protein [Leifsonia sp. AG29]|uniref:YeiH family protein n=1 Tax=Leifsonia sp. AG29 TaxID=2598860 RepID=UPI001E39F097|nr:putative sulfate exporter family transporter [Leifsonia sp. AG29]
MTPSPAQPRPPLGWLPGVAVAGLATALAWTVHWLLPAIPLLTAAVVLGIVVGQLPAARPALVGPLAAGLSVSSKRLMRIGVVLLGLKLSLGDIARLGWVTILSTVLVVVIAFAGTFWIGRLMRLPGHEPLLLATGFSICGASAIGAMSGVVRPKDEEQATPVALVTLCGTLAIFVLPLLWRPLGLDAVQFGHWVGAGVHDVGQVVATAQIAGPAALAVAIVVKLTRVLTLAPMVAIASVVERRRHVAGDPTVKRPPIVPLFVAGFVAAVLLRTFVPLPPAVTGAADSLQTVLLAMALFGLGTAVRLRTLLSKGWRALVTGLASWVLIAALALAAVWLTAAAG